MNTYNRIPLLTRGERVWVWDESGKKYLDALAGIAVNTLRPRPRETGPGRSQEQELASDPHLQPLPHRRAGKARGQARGDQRHGQRVLLQLGLRGQRGGDQLARLYGHGKGRGQPRDRGHGQGVPRQKRSRRSRPPVTASAAGIRAPGAGLVRVPFNDIESVRQAASHDKNIVAVLVEPIQGEGGINISSMRYLRDLRELCDRQGWLLMLDEVQCGWAARGKWFVYQHAGIQPDVVLLAKGLALGRADRRLPRTRSRSRGVQAGNSRLHVRRQSARLRGSPRDPCSHRGGRSHEERRARRRGPARRAARGTRGCSGVAEVRGHGLMIGVELDRPCGDLVGQALEAGLLINVTMDKVIRLLPPLVMNEGEARQVLSILVPLVRSFLAQPAPRCRRAHEKGQARLRHYLQFKDFSREEYEHLFARTRWIRTSSSATERYWPLEDRTLAMIFEKPSTRTRLSFEAGMHQLGGAAIYLYTRDSQLGRGEAGRGRRAQVISRCASPACTEDRPRRRAGACPASNERRVRVEGFSKIMARVRSSERPVALVALELVLDPARAREKVLVLSRESP